MPYRPELTRDGSIFHRHLPPVYNETPASYAQRLAAAGLCVHLPLADLKRGALRDAMAKATEAQLPIYTPLEPGETRLDAAFAPKPPVSEQEKMAMLDQARRGSA